jgi:hypothetical protein
MAAREPTYTSSDGTERPCSRISPVHAARILAKDRAEGDGSTLPADVRAALELRAALADGTADDRATPFGASGPGAAGMIRHTAASGGRPGAYAGAFYRDEYRKRPAPESAFRTVEYLPAGETEYRESLTCRAEDLAETCRALVDRGASDLTINAPGAAPDDDRG